MMRAFKAIAVGACAMLFTMTSYTATSDRDLFYQPWQTKKRAPLVAAGNAAIDDALERLIPTPYAIILDESVPATMYLAWPSSDNWMLSLELALAPIGLQARPDWANNRIVIGWSRPAQAPVLPADAPAPVPMANAATAIAAVHVPQQLAAVHVQPKRTEPAVPERRGKFVVSTPVVTINAGQPYASNAYPRDGRNQ